jgi:hypothetical protein
MFAQAKKPDTAGVDAAFSQLADRYFDEYYFKFSPSQGTAAGFHQYDDQLEDYSHASVERQVALLKKFKPEFLQHVEGRRCPFGDHGWGLTQAPRDAVAGPVRYPR